jgi:hypothetical protein
VAGSLCLGGVSVRIEHPLPPPRPGRRLSALQPTHARGCGCPREAARNAETQSGLGDEETEVEKVRRTSKVVSPGGAFTSGRDLVKAHRAICAITSRSGTKQKVLTQLQKRENLPVVKNKRDGETRVSGIANMYLRALLNHHVTVLLCEKAEEDGGFNEEDSEKLFGGFDMRWQHTVEAEGLLNVVACVSFRAQSEKKVILSFSWVLNLSLYTNLLALKVGQTAAQLVDLKVKPSATVTLKTIARTPVVAAQFSKFGKQMLLRLLVDTKRRLIDPRPSKQELLAMIIDIRTYYAMKSRKDDEAIDRLGLTASERRAAMEEFKLEVQKTAEAKRVWESQSGALVQSEAEDASAESAFVEPSSMPTSGLAMVAISSRASMSSSDDMFAQFGGAGEVFGDGDMDFLDSVTAAMDCEKTQVEDDEATRYIQWLDTQSVADVLLPQYRHKASEISTMSLLELYDCTDVQSFFNIDVQSKFPLVYRVALRKLLGMISSSFEERVNSTGMCQCWLP